MYIRAAIGIALVAFVTAPTQLASQAAAGMEPAPVLQIYREQIKPGKTRAHAASENAWGKALEASPIKWLAMTSMSGPSEAWFLSGFGSYADIQKVNETMETLPAMLRADSVYSSREGEFLNDTRSLIATYRKDLSYGAPVDIAKMRYMQVITFRVRPGREMDFATVAKAFAAAYQKAKVEAVWAVYEVGAGMPGPAYLLMMPSRDLAALDRDMASQPVVMAGLADAATVMKTWTDAAISAEANIFEFSSRMSNLTAEFRSRDAAFWNKR